MSLGSCIQYSLSVFLLSRLKWWMNDAPVYSYTWLSCTQHIFPGCSLKETEHIKKDLLKRYFEGKTTTRPHTSTPSRKTRVTVFVGQPKPLADERQKWRAISTRFFVTAAGEHGQRGSDPLTRPLGKAWLHGHVPEKRGSPCQGDTEREPAPGKEAAIHLLHRGHLPYRIKLGKNFKILRKPLTVGFWWDTESWTWLFYVTARDSFLNTILWSWVWFWSQWSQGQNILWFNWKQKQAPALTLVSANRIQLDVNRRGNMFGTGYKSMRDFFFFSLCKIKKRSLNFFPHSTAVLSTTGPNSALVPSRTTPAQAEDPVSLLSSTGSHGVPLAKFVHRTACKFCNGRI